MERGIALDSWSSAYVMPKRVVPQFNAKESTGSTRGANLLVASGTVVKNEGEKTLVFNTKSGHTRRITFQVADVNNILASVAKRCDGGSGVLFITDDGVTITLNTCSNTFFDRRGNVCARSMSTK